ncbi:CKLF-like MARVEL transmembrane domain-containing protein 3 isoform X1 [Carettochelys insculpta]|uniref:CKLF-like MARVEL transmembrane domain-containing protein 3 isoform X1 n=1 Tax=Carettochelys insculpta TaxID=44489 RepID=UPI003EBDE537
MKIVSKMKQGKSEPLVFTLFLGSTQALQMSEATLFHKEGKQHLLQHASWCPVRLWVLSFITFICYIASSAASFMMAPLIEFLLALFLFFAYSSKLNEKFKGIYWPLTDFLRCVTAAIIYFAISIAAVSKYSDGASKAAGVFGFIATIAFAVDFYITFNDLVKFLKQGGSENATEAQKSEDEDSGSDSD